MEDEEAIEICIDFYCNILAKNYSTHPDKITADIRKEHEEFRSKMSSNGYESTISQRPFGGVKNNTQHYLIKVSAKRFNRASEEIYSKDFTMDELREIKRKNSIDKLVDGK